MNEIDDYFIKRTDERFDKVDEHFKEVNRKIDENSKEMNRKMDIVINRNNFIYGGVFVLSALVSLGITIVFGR